MLFESVSSSPVPGSELFALDVNLVVQLLSSLDGTKVYPKDESKEDAFDQATEQRGQAPTGRASPTAPTTWTRTSRACTGASATMVGSGGSFVVKAGSVCLTDPSDKWRPEAKKTALIENGVLRHDVTCRAPSTAGWVVLDRSNNGWKVWRAEDGRYLDSLRKSND